MTASGIRAGAAFVELGVRNRITRPLAKIRGRLNAFASNVSSIGRRLLGAAAGISVPIAASVKVYSDFADQMAVVRAVSGATADEFAALEEKAKELGRTTSFTASQVAGAQAELGRAGFDPTQINQAIGSVLSLSRATSTELPEAAAIAGAALRGFGLDASETGRVADVLTATANGSAQTLTDLFESLKLVAPLARKTGTSIEDTSAALAVLANNGLKGSIAGNSVGRAMKNLANENKAARLLELTGVQATDANNNLRPLAEVLRDVGKATESFGTADRLAAFEEIFGRGQLAALNLSGDDSVFEFAESLKNVDGVADQTAAKLNDNIGGAFRRLGSAVEGVQIAIGEALAGELSGFVDKAVEIAGTITEWIANNQELVASIAKGIAIVGAIGAGLIAFGGTAAAASVAVGGIISIVSAGVVVFKVLAAAVAFLISPVGLAIAAIVGIGAAILYFTGSGSKALAWLRDQFDALKQFVGPIVEGIKDALAAGDVRLAARILWQGIQVAFRIGVLKVSSIWQGFKASALATFDGLVVGIRKRWNSASTFLARGMLKLTGLIDRTFDAEGAIAVLEQDAARFENRIDAEAAARDAERRARGAEAIAAAEAELKQSRAELDQLLADAKLARSLAERGDLDVGDEPPEPPPFELPQLDDGGVGRAIKLATAGSSGAFSASAAALLGQSGSVAERTAAAAERVADNTDELLDREAAFF